MLLSRHPGTAALSDGRAEPFLVSCTSAGTCHAAAAYNLAPGGPEQINPLSPDLGVGANVIVMQESHGVWQGAARHWQPD